MSLLIDDKTKERQDLQCYTQSVKTVHMKTDGLRGCAGHGKRKEPITAETFMDIPLTPEESRFVKEIAADLLIRKRAVPDESDLLKEILYRAMLVSGSEVPEH